MFYISGIIQTSICLHYNVTYLCLLDPTSGYVRRTAVQSIEAPFTNIKKPHDIQSIFACLNEHLVLLNLVFLGR